MIPCSGAKRSLCLSSSCSSAMNRFIFSLSLLPLQFFAGLAASSAQVQEGDMFPSKSAALQRAKHLKCSGVFQMGDKWMPCHDFSAYQKAIKNEK